MRFGRNARVKIRIANGKGSGYRETIEIQGLRIAFNITKSQSYSLNTLSLQIWNLGQSNRNLLKKIGDEITLEAWYELEGEENKLTFIGDSTKVSHQFVQPDIITSIECLDGQRFFLLKLINVSYTEKMPIRDIIRDICTKNYVDIAYFAPSDNIIYPSGFSHNQSLKLAIDILTEALGLQAILTNGSLYIVPKNQSISRNSYIVNVNNAMVNVPERYVFKYRNLLTGVPEIGFKVKTLLRPEILPGDTIRVTSQKADLKGNYFVAVATHQGDTHGDPWDSTFEVYLKNDLSN